MNTTAIVNIDTPLIGALYIKVDGDLNLRQKSSIDRTTFCGEDYYGNIFEINKGDLLTYDEISNEYYSRNLSTHYD